MTSFTKFLFLIDILCQSNIIQTSDYSISNCLMRGCYMLTERESEILRIIREDPMIKQQDLAKKVGITRSSVAVHVSNLISKGYVLGKGYVVKENEYVSICGGANIDLIGFAGDEFVIADSNPGKVEYLLGGVGRNQADNLRLLDVDVNFVTAFGGDFHGERLRKDCIRKGINITHSISVPHTSTSTYLSIIKPDGSLYAGVNEMSIYEYLTPDILRPILPMLNRSTVCSLDTNLTREAISFLAENVQAPIFCETISVAKAGKIRDILPRIHTLRSDLADIEYLLDMKINCEKSINLALDKLLDAGIKNIFISTSPHEVVCASQQMRLTLKYNETSIESKNGARDSFVSALIWAHIRGLDLTDSALAGMASAMICSSTRKLVNEELNEQYLLDKMEEIRRQL